MLGPALGFGFFALAVMIRGGWVVAFPVFSCWAFGGFIGLLVVAGAARRNGWLVAAALALVALAALVWAYSALRSIG